MHYKQTEKFTKMAADGATPDELRAAMAESEIDKQEAEDLIASLYTNQQKPPTITDEEIVALKKEMEKKENESAPENTIPKFAYDRENLDGTAFSNYEKHIQSLPLNDMVDFELYKVDVIMTERYAGLPNTPRDMTGVRITNNKPLHRSRISPHTVLDFNAQVRNTSKYYLLAY